MGIPSILSVLVLRIDDPILLNPDGLPVSHTGQRAESSRVPRFGHLNDELETFWRHAQRDRCDTLHLQNGRTKVPMRYE